MHTSGDLLSAPIDELSELALAEPEDKDLVLAFKRGEKNSYQAIHERYGARVRSVCRRMLSNGSDAEEAAQETFLRVYSALPHFNGRYQLGAWMSRVATNVCLDQLRSQKRRPSESTDPEQLASLPETIHVDGPEQLFIASDDSRRIRKILEGLSPMHRAALSLREFEGMSYEDIAIALGMTDAQVKALLHRARKAFRRSWSSAGLAALLPWRLLARLRRAAGPVGDGHHQVADAATSGMHVAAQCSSVLQQCGQFVTERVATTVTAIVVGTAAVGVAIAPSGKVPEVKHHAIASQPSPSQDGIGHRRSERKGGSRKNDRSRGSAAVPTEPSTEPTPAPASSTAPPKEGSEPAPEQNSGGSTGTDGGTSKPANPAPPPLYTYFGWERGQPIPRAQATQHKTRLDCAARTLDHRVETMISDGAFSYRAVFDIHISVNPRLSFAMWKDGIEYRYSSWGNAPVVAWSGSGSQTRLEITGEYGALYGSDTESGKLPSSGHFDATLTLDCTALSVVTEGAVFTAE